jgi:predicted PurR-regulated permease PerM
LIFWILGLPAPFLWGFVMAVAAFLPVVGTWMIWFPAAVVLMVGGDLVKGIILIAWGILVLSILSSMLYPILIGDRLRLNTLLVFVAIFGGIMAFGMVGIVFGPLVVALTITLIEIWKNRLDKDQAAIPET